jgi:hypothetical protein
MVHTLAFRELPFWVGTMGGVTIKRNEFNSSQPPIGHTSLVGTDTMPAFLAAQSDVLFFHPDKDPSDVNESSHGCSTRTVPSFLCSMSCFLFHVFSLSFRRRSCGVY